MAVMADEIGHGPTRIQLQRKSPRAWQEFMDHLHEHSPLGMANTMRRYQALRPSLYDFREQFATMTTPVLLALGDEDAPCLETNLMLKQAIPGVGAVDPSPHRATPSTSRSRRRSTRWSSRSSPASSAAPPTCRPPDRLA